MKQQRFSGPLVTCLLASIFLSVCGSISYAGDRPGSFGPRSLSMVPRAYLAFDARSASRFDPLSHLSSASHQTTMDTLGKLSVVGGVLLTADRLIRAADSMRETNLLQRADGSCFRLNTEPTAKGFMVGFTLSRPLDF